ncbi:hypothetical protein DFJ63DRAFT_311797 [Scheffersomyces coipomensis]|uniref:uncharacterized protein n=1 Tax=Scheffersomyces coipomensis TaxID=1788519 RepID=UPI00315CEC2C
MNSLLSYHYPLPQQQSSQPNNGSDPSGNASANLSGGAYNSTSTSNSPFINNTNNTKLPSIHSLALPTNVPTIPTNHHIQQSSAVMLPPLLAAGRTGTSPINSSLSYSPSYTTSNNSNNSTTTTTANGINTSSISPISSPNYYQESYRSSFVDQIQTQHPQPQSHPQLQRSSISVIPPNQVASPLSSSNSTISSNDESDSNTESVTSSSTTSSINGGVNKKWKPRKKRQCPECKLYFSNLATHKSTHLKPTSRPHICKYCNRGFARSNDLFRHVKCHWKEIGSDKGQFKCPFKQMEDPSTSEVKVEHEHSHHEEIEDRGVSVDDNCCHQTGIFSRCDTFKNHLKAIHFQYPNGTKKDQRTKVAGKCRMCQIEFKNVDDWLSNHIEKNQCPYAVNVLSKE